MRGIVVLLGEFKSIFRKFRYNLKFSLQVNMKVIED